MRARLAMTMLAGLMMTMAAIAADPMPTPEDIELKRIQTFLGILNQELTAEYEQVKALQQSIQLNTQSEQRIAGRAPDVQFYDDVAAAQRRALERENSLRSQLDAALERIREIEGQKRPLLDRVRELIGVAPPPPSAAGTGPGAARVEEPPAGGTGAARKSP